MTVPSYAFFGFALLAAIALDLARGPRSRAGVWLAANLAFFATFVPGPLGALPYFGLLASAYASICIARRNKNRALFTLLLLANLAAFCTLKRYAFVPHQALPAIAYTTAGMSYVFFRLLHLLIDAYEDTLPGPLGPIAYLNYSLNFPSFVAGPIQLYGDYLRSLGAAGQRPPADALVRAAQRILLGFFKVAALGPLLGSVHDRAATTMLLPGVSHTAAVLNAALAVALFPLSLYVNFSGYTDVAIGVARFLRLELPENFDAPFSATGAIDFFGRWHMTLSNWVKTYVYSPLLMAMIRRLSARNVTPPGVLAYFVTFFLVGMWHGQTWMFAMYGVALGAGPSANKLYEIVMMRGLGRAGYEALIVRPWFVVTARALTYTWFALAAVWFCYTDVQLASVFEALGPTGAFAALGIVFAVVLPVLALAESLRTSVRRLQRVSLGTIPGASLRAAWFAMLAVVVFALTVIVQAPAPQIVYKAF